MALLRTTHKYLHNTILGTRLGHTLPHFRISGSCIAPRNPFSYWQKCIAEIGLVVEASLIHTESERLEFHIYIFILFTTAGCA